MTKTSWLLIAIAGLLAFVMGGAVALTQDTHTPQIQDIRRITGNHREDRSCLRRCHRCRSPPRSSGRRRTETRTTGQVMLTGMIEAKVTRRDRIEAKVVRTGMIAPTMGQSTRKRLSRRSNTPLAARAMSAR